MSSRSKQLGQQLSHYIDKVEGQRAPYHRKTTMTLTKAGSLKGVFDNAAPLRTRFIEEVARATTDATGIASAEEAEELDTLLRRETFFASIESFLANENVDFSTAHKRRLVKAAEAVWKF